MKRISISIIASIAAALLITSASAGELGDFGKSKPTTWGGVYIGAGVGFNSLDYSLNGNQTYDVSDTFECDASGWLDGVCLNFTNLGAPYNDSKSLNISDDDWERFLTLQVGVDAQIGPYIVVGVFADWDISDGTSASTSTSLTNFNKEGIEIIDVGTTSLSINTDDTWSVGGRLGFLVTPKFLLYGLAGYIQTDVDATLTASYDDFHGLGQPQTQSVSLSDEMHGYFIGAGGEYMLNKFMSIKTEYRYADLDGLNNAGNSYNMAFAPINADTWNNEILSQDIDLDAEQHSIRANVVFRLNWQQ